MAAAGLREQRLEFAGGVVGVDLDIPSASPVNYHQAIAAPDGMPPVVIDGKLFLPSGAEPPHAAVLVVPGSLGVAASHVRHAETLCGLGFAACILDSFAARGVTSTVADQTQYSFAASAYDVLAGYRALAGRDDIDAGRIGAQGHSRGGSAVVMAACRRLADAVVGPGRGLAAVLAAYPWCGQQFERPDVGATEVLALMGDADEWCAPAQVQAQCHAIRLAGGAASVRLLGGAHHSYDRDTPLELVADARVARGAPITYLADDGAMIHPLAQAPDPELVDRDVMLHASKSGYGRRGAHIGSAPGEAETFRRDMVGFWRRVLGGDGSGPH